MDDVEMSDVGAGAEAAKTDEEKVMADSGVAATVSVSLHPADTNYFQVHNQCNRALFTSLC